MIFFIVLLLLSCIAAFDLTKKGTDVKQLIVFFMLGVFLVIAGLRSEYEVISDWAVYSTYFQSAPPITSIFNWDYFISYQPPFEFGYFLLNAIIKAFTDSPYVFFFIVEFVICVLLYKSLKKYTKRVAIALLIYFTVLFTVLDVAYIRQGIAVGLFLFSIQYIEGRKLAHYFLWVTAAAAFHSSALVLYPLYFICNRVFSSKLVIVVLAISVLPFLLKIDVVSPLLYFFPDNPRVDYYLATSKYSVSRPLSFTHAEFLLVLTVLLSYRKRIDKLRLNNAYLNIFINLFVIYGILIFLFFGVSVVSARLKFYFLTSFLIIFPAVLGLLNENSRLIGYFMLVLYLFIYMATLYQLTPYYSTYKNALFH
jgi:hypothetical protein